MVRTENVQNLLNFTAVELTKIKEQESDQKAE